MTRRGRAGPKAGHGSWHHVTDSAAFEAVREEIVRLANPGPEDTGVDLGAGPGPLALPLAHVIGHVVAVDASPGMTDELRRRADAAGLTSFVTITADLTQFALPRESVDLVVSNYALHHVHNADKRAIVARARRWLRPGGRLVIGDMMFGRGLSNGDGAILRTKMRRLAAKGPGGYWRITKNLVKFGLHVGGTYPAPPQFWITALRDAGFQDVGHLQVVEEAGIVWGHL
jgi:SAM-dependent methyltransferase